MGEYDNIKAISKISYDSEDIAVLIELASQMDCMDSWKIQKSFLGVGFKEYPLVLYKAIKKIRGQKFSKYRYFVYTVPFEEVPLYINSKNLKFFVQWRMKIGK